MSQTTAVEFQRRFGEYQHQAQREPLEITRHGRRELVRMSAEHYDWLKTALHAQYVNFNLFNSARSSVPLQNHRRRRDRASG